MISQVKVDIIVKMLSKIARTTLMRAFSTANSSSVSSGIVSTLGTGLTTETLSQSSLVAQQQNSLAELVRTENEHLTSYVNEIKQTIRNTIDINFQDLNAEEVTVLESPTGENNWKLGELLVLGSTAKLLQLLAGFPSYGALVGTLGVAGVGAVLSYSNYLRRSASQITAINLNRAGQLRVFYLKPDGLFGRSENEFTVDRKSFAYASFGNEVENWVRKCNATTWVRIDGELFWYNSDQATLKVNSHVSDKLF